MRYPEIDLLRTFAILCMVIYHGAYDLETMYGWQIGLSEGLWPIFQKAVASLFLLLSGISFAIAHERAKVKGNPWKRHLKRAATVLGAAMLVTVATWVMNPETYVRFGILHLVGVGILLLPFFVRFKEANILIGLLVMIAGGWIGTLRASSAFLLPLGIMYPGFRTVDYFPLVPWFGVMMMGMGVGYFVYVRHRAWREWIAAGNVPSARRKRTLGFCSPWMMWPGRHSLGIYVWHQPVLFLVLWAVLGRSAV